MGHYFARPATGGGVTFPGFLYDVLYDCETAPSGDFAINVVDGVINAQDAAALKRGTYGMSAAAGTVAERYLEWAKAGADYASITFGFYYKTGEYANFDDNKRICDVRNAGYGSVLNVREGKPGGTLSIPHITWSLDADEVEVEINTWYFIAVRYTTSGTCELAVFDMTGTIIGSMSATDATAANVNTIWWGTYATASITATYFDDIFIRYTGTTSELLPFPTGT